MTAVCFAVGADSTPGPGRGSGGDHGVGDAVFQHFILPGDAGGAGAVVGPVGGGAEQVAHIVFRSQGVETTHTDFLLLPFGIFRFISASRCWLPKFSGCQNDRTAELL